MPLDPESQVEIVDALKEYLQTRAQLESERAVHANHLLNSFHPYVIIPLNDILEHFNKMRGFTCQFTYDNRQANPRSVNLNIKDEKSLNLSITITGTSNRHGIVLKSSTREKPIFEGTDLKEVGPSIIKDCVIEAIQKQKRKLSESEN